MTTLNDADPQGDSPDATAAQGDSPDGTPAQSAPASTDPGETPDSNTPDDDGQDDGNPDDDSNREAARWRRKLRDAQAEFDTQRAQLEGERDQAHAQLDTLRQDIVTQIAAAAGLPAELLDKAGLDQLDDFLNEDGTPDRAKITAAAADTVTRLEIGTKGRPPRANHQQPGGGSPRATDGWKAAFAPRPLR